MGKRSRRTAERGAAALAREEISRIADAVKRMARVSGPDTPWCADDRAWFEAHPDRRQRFRALFPGEAVATGAAAAAMTHVYVTQVRPGIRKRELVALPSTLAFEWPASDDACAARWLPALGGF